MPLPPPTDPDPPAADEPSSPVASTSSATAPPHRDSAPWAWAAAAVVIVAILTGAGLYVFRSLRDAPGAMVDKGREVVRDLADVAAAFRQGTVETRFISYATGVSSGKKLQFATLEQVERFSRRDRASVLWGYLELPEVVVEVIAPVEYTYFLDLEGSWEMTQSGNTIRVIAPPIQANTPAVDPSAIEYTVRQGSLLRDEEVAVEQLRRTLAELTRLRAEDHVPLVRELGRRKTAEFVETWLAGNFDDGGEYRVEVIFVDELPALPDESEVETLPPPRG